MSATCNMHIRKVMDLAGQLIALADEGEEKAQHDSCIVLYGIVRDCAYRIRQEAEREREKHVTAGTWNES